MTKLALRSACAGQRRVRSPIPIAKARSKGGRRKRGVVREDRTFSPGVRPTPQTWRVFQNFHSIVPGITSAMRTGGRKMKPAEAEEPATREEPGL